MLTNFEKETFELTDLEMLALPHLIKGFSRYTKENPIKSDEIINSFNAYLQRQNIGIKITGVRLRKFCNYIRQNALLPLIATSSGYYVSNDKNEIEKQIKSLYERAKSIRDSADGLKKFIQHG